MELIIVIAAMVAVFVAFRMGHQNGVRIGASKTQSELLRGATLDLSETEQNELALQISHVTRESPSSSLRNLDGFITRAFEMGRLTAQANWHAGAAYQERTSRAATERYD